MSRPGISYEAVVAAAQQVVEQGEKPTISRVRTALGDKGSVTTISKHLKAWREAGAVAAETTSSTVVAEQKENPAADIATLAKETEAASTAPKTAATAEVKTAAVETVTLVELTKTQDATQKEQSTAKDEAEAEKHAARPNNEKRRNKRRKKLCDQDFTAPMPEVEIPEEPKLTFVDIEQYALPDIESLNETNLKVQLRKLLSFTQKEQSRRMAAEKMAREAMVYADSIKEQVADRIQVVRHEYEDKITELNKMAEQCKADYEKDLIYFRRGLERANQRMVELVPDKVQNQEKPKQSAEQPKSAGPQITVKPACKPLSIAKSGVEGNEK